FPPPAAVAAGGRRQRGGVDRRLSPRRLAVARLAPRAGGRPAGGGDDAGIDGAAQRDARRQDGGRRGMNARLWGILFGAIATYRTRAGGHLGLSRFERVHPRVEAGLDAVPAAVLTTLVAPAAAAGGPAELAALVVTGLVALRGSMLTVFLAGGATLVLL